MSSEANPTDTIGRWNRLLRRNSNKAKDNIKRFSSTFEEAKTRADSQGLIPLSDIKDGDDAPEPVPIENFYPEKHPLPIEEEAKQPKTTSEAYYGGLEVAPDYVLPEPYFPTKEINSAASQITQTSSTPAVAGPSVSTPSTTTPPISPPIPSGSPIEKTRRSSSGNIITKYTLSRFSRKEIEPDPQRVTATTLLSELDLAFYPDTHKIKGSWHNIGTAITTAFTTTGTPYDELTKTLLSDEEVAKECEKRYFPLLHALVAVDHQKTIHEHLKPKSFQIKEKRSSDGATPLHIAAEKGRITLAQFLIKRGADLAATDSNIQTPLLRCAQSGQAEMLLFLLPLYNFREDHTMIKSLLAARRKSSYNQKLPPERKDVPANIQQAYLEGARGGHTSIVQALLYRGVGLNTVDSNNTSALMLAVQNSHFAVAQVLLHHHIDVNIAHDTTKMTALMYAAENGHSELTKLMVENRARVNEKNHYGQTALELAIWSDDYESVQTLLDNGADLRDTITNGRSYLVLACQKGDPKLVEILVKAGADVKFAGKAKYAPIHYAALHEDNGEMVDILLDKGGSEYKEEQFSQGNYYKEEELDVVYKNPRVAAMLGVRVAVESRVVQE